MAIQILPTLNNTIISGSDYTTTEYYDDCPDKSVKLAEIQEQSVIAGMFNPVSFDQGDLMVVINAYPVQTDLYIDTLGNLVIVSTIEDVNDYSINSNGELEVICYV